MTKGIHKNDQGAQSVVEAVVGKFKNAVTNNVRKENDTLVHALDTCLERIGFCIIAILSLPRDLRL